MALNENIERLVDKSVFILREAKARFKNPAVMWSSGKDSTLMLELCKQAFFNKVPFPVIHIDTGRKFLEIYEFRNRIAKEWDLDLIVAKAENQGILPGNTEESVTACCMALKVEPWKKIVKERGFDALIMSIRRDEHPMRNYERYFSPRDAKDWEWHLVKPKTKEDEGDAPFISEQDTELAGWNLYGTEYTNCDHVRVHPILHWTEQEIWTYTSLLDIPFNPLYLKGYRSLGCQCCTTKAWDTPPKDINEIMERVTSSPGKERAGRAQDKENAQVMRRLRMMGYC